MERGPEYWGGGVATEVRPVEERGARAKEQGTIPGEKGHMGAGSVAVVRDVGMSVCRVKVGKWAVVRGASEGLRGWLERNLTFKNPRYEQQVRFGRDVEDAEPNFRMCRYRGRGCDYSEGVFVEVDRLVPWAAGEVRVRGRVCQAAGEEADSVEGRVERGAGAGFESYRREALRDTGWGPRVRPAVGGDGQGGREAGEGSDLGEDQEAAVCLGRFFGAACGGGCGLLGDGKKQVEADVLVAIDRSFYLNLEDGNVVGRGVVIVDRIDEVNPKVFMTGLGSVDCGVSLGLACSKRRKDRLTGLMEACAGPVIGEMEGGGAVTKGLRVMIMESGIRIGDDLDWAAVKKKLMADDGRNFRISQELGVLTSNGRRALVVSHE